MVPFKKTLLLILTLLIVAALSVETHITSGVASYNHTAPRKILMDSTGEFYAANTLTQLGLLWWIPEVLISGTDTVVTGDVVFDTMATEELEGAVDFTGDPTVDSADVAWYVEWGNKNNVLTSLTLGFAMLHDLEVSYSENWELQKLAFHDNQEVFVNSILREVDKYDLDGLDIDLEGVTQYRDEFREFVRIISDSMSVREKPLNIAVQYNNKWMAVNPDWWEDYVGLVNQILIMGYHNVYEGATEVEYPGIVADNRFTTLYNHGRSVGYDPVQLSFCLPAWLDHWGKGGRGTHFLDHLEGLRRDLDSTVSICLWDSELYGDGWNSPLMWQTLSLINTPPAVTITSPALGDSITLDDGNVIMKWPGDQITMEWDVHSLESMVKQEISIRYHGSSEWVALDTLSPEEREYSFASSFVKNSLFAVRVSLLNAEGKLIDYDKSDGYVVCLGNTPILESTLKSTSQMSIQCVGKQVKITSPGQGTYSLSLFSLNGRQIVQESGLFVGTGVSMHSLPKMLSPGMYVVRIESEVGTLNQMIQFFK